MGMSRKEGRKRWSEGIRSGVILFKSCRLPSYPPSAPPSWFVPSVSPHTTSRKGRRPESCHGEPEGDMRCIEGKEASMYMCVRVCYRIHTPLASCEWDPVILFSEWCGGRTVYVLSSRFSSVFPSRFIMYTPFLNVSLGIRTHSESRPTASSPQL